MFIYKNPDSLRHIFHAKNSALCAMFLILKFIVYYIMIDNYKRKYNQSDQIDK